MNAQTGEFYSIKSAIKNPKAVKTLYLNFNFTEIQELPKEIGELENLEELIFFHRIFDFRKIEGKKVISNKLDDSELKSVSILPNEIANCKKLRIMDFTFSSLKRLPSNLNQFQNLELIRLTNTPINLDNEINNLLSIENQITLEILNCNISEENIEKLKDKKNIKVLAKREDYGISEKVKTESVDLQLHSTYMVFANISEANRFINSMPKTLQEKARNSLIKK